MGWSWPDLWHTPERVVAAAMTLMNSTVTQQAVATSRQELVLQALKTAKEAAKRRR